MNADVFILAIAIAASVHHFGWIDGIGLSAALWLLMPFRPSRG
jgi:hypothetical protein